MDDTERKWGGVGINPLALSEPPTFTPCPLRDREQEYIVKVK